VAATLGTCGKCRARFRLRNDLYCVGWGVKLYSPHPRARLHVEKFHGTQKSDETELQFKTLSLLPMLPKILTHLLEDCGRRRLTDGLSGFNMVRKERCLLLCCLVTCRENVRTYNCSHRGRRTGLLWPMITAILFGLSLSSLHSKFTVDYAVRRRMVYAKQGNASQVFFVKFHAGIFPFFEITCQKVVSRSLAEGADAVNNYLRCTDRSFTAHSMYFDARIRSRIEYLIVAVVIYLYSASLVALYSNTHSSTLTST